jgi:hypothetical protein
LCDIYKDTSYKPDLVNVIFKNIISEEYNEPFYYINKLEIIMKDVGIVVEDIADNGVCSVVVIDDDDVGAVVEEGGSDNDDD